MMTPMAISPGLTWSSAVLAASRQVCHSQGV